MGYAPLSHAPPIPMARPPGPPVGPPPGAYGAPPMPYGAAPPPRYPPRPMNQPLPAPVVAKLSPAAELARDVAELQKGAGLRFLVAKHGRVHADGAEPCALLSQALPPDTAGALVNKIGRAFSRDADAIDFVHEHASRALCEHLVRFLAADCAAKCGPDAGTADCALHSVCGGNRGALLVGLADVLSAPSAAPWATMSRRPSTTRAPCRRSCCR